MSEFKESKRAQRRHHLIRMKAKARRVFACYRNEMDLKHFERLANHLAHCRKPCCNRPRRYEGVTLQEKIFKSK
jgi:hypothetical protein